MHRLTTFLGCSIMLALAAAGRAEPGHSFPALSSTELEAIRAALPARARAAPAKARRVLIFYRTEGYVHDSVPFANQALAELGSRTGAYHADLSEDPEILSPARLAPYDAIVLNNTTHLALSNAQRAALLAFVRSGKGLAGIHAASDSFYTWPEGQSLLGGIFVSHPWTKDATVAVKIDDPRSPVTAAFDGHGFWVKDEIYQIDGPYSRGHVHVLLSLDMSRPENARPPDKLVRGDNDFPIAWIRREGHGRVFYCSLGHNPEIYSTREILQHYLDGIQFAIGDLRADATPTDELQAPPAAAPAPATPAAVIDTPR